MSKFDLSQFCASPTVEALSAVRLRKSDWIEIAQKFKIKVFASWKKARIVNTVVNCMVASELLGEDALSLCLDEGDGAQLKLKELEDRKEQRMWEMRKLELEMEKFERERQLETERFQRAEREREWERERALVRQKEMEFQSRMTDKKSSSNDVAFDPAKHCRLVPEFDEAQPDEFFSHFEKVAVNMNWPKAYWPTLVQNALKGKGKTTYLTLTTDQSLDYDTVKESVIKCYELTAEYYNNNNKIRVFFVMSACSFKGLKFTSAR